MFEVMNEIVGRRGGGVIIRSVKPRNKNKAKKSGRYPLYGRFSRPKSKRKLRKGKDPVWKIFKTKVKEKIEQKQGFRDGAG
ncbi:hypothetical protein LIER_21400 [Lithospermum erythrorhizon]|uniref:Uncharacterized protein n=1 Tax=Lithospermum erythrorhizon TaxID=34254 RepID=A0AAV3QT00_LITER